MSTATENEGLEALCAYTLELLQTGEFSDFSVVCGDRTWKTHKNILCRIEYFDKVITSGLKESQENQINIPNFQPFEIDLLLRYIYHPRVDVESACDQNTPRAFLEICVRLWQLGDYYGIETLATSAQEQLQKRTRRYIVEAGHVGKMLNLVPFVSELEDAIRAAWDLEKAPGPHRRLLLSLCQALGPYLHGYSGILALFDEIPEFAAEFSKAVLGCGATFSRGTRSRTKCYGCGDNISTKVADLRADEAIFHPVGHIAALNDSQENWYCCVCCCEGAGHSNHDDCQICERYGLEE